MLVYKIKPKINSVLPISMEKKQNELKILKIIKVC